MSLFQNLDLLSVGVAVAAIGILGFIVFLNNKRSATHNLFFYFALVSVIWSVVNYASYAIIDIEIRLWLIRLVLFFAVFQALTLFLLLYSFPEQSIPIKRPKLIFLIILAIVVSLFTLTPWIFYGVQSTEGRVSQPVIEPGIITFLLYSVGLVAAGIFALTRKMISLSSEERVPFKNFLTGVVIMFGLILIFDVFFPVVLKDTRLIPFTALFIFPFIAFATHAILRHHLLGVKVIATEIITFILAVVTLAEVIFSESLGQRVFRIGVFLIMLSFGILLIKSVRREVEQRELLEELNAELEKQKAQVEELSNFKTQLLSFASHQLKAPMAVIKGYSSILLEGLYGPVKGKVRETIVKMRESTDELIGLINTLLDMRRIDEGRMEYQFSEVDLGELVAHVIDGLAPLAEKKKLKLTFKKPDHLVKVRADGPKLAQVIGNLVENAIKYTEKGSVEVMMTDDQKLIKDSSGNDVMVSVKDTGLGISATLAPHLFEEFTRDERVKKEIRGTGLGLYIARKMIEAHEGVVWAESEGEGKGSTFFIKLRKL